MCIYSAVILYMSVNCLHVLIHNAPPARHAAPPPHPAGPLDTMLRALVIGRLGSCDDKAVISEAKTRFRDHVTGKCALPADLRGPVRLIDRHTRLFELCSQQRAHTAQLKLCLLV